MMITMFDWIMTIGLIALVVIYLIITIDEVNRNGNL